MVVNVWQLILKRKEYWWSQASAKVTWIKLVIYFPGGKEINDQYG